MCSFSMQPHASYMNNLNFTFSTTTFIKKKNGLCLCRLHLQICNEALTKQNKHAQYITIPCVTSA